MAVSLARPIPSNDIFLCIGAGSDCIEKFFAEDSNDSKQKPTDTKGEIK